MAPARGRISARRWRDTTARRGSARGSGLARSDARVTNARVLAYWRDAARGRTSTGMIDFDESRRAVSCRPVRTLHAATTLYHGEARRRARPASHLRTPRNAL